MAINPSVQLAPNIEAPNADYIYGSAKNETAPGAKDGTPYKKVRADDVFGLMQAALNVSSIVPSGNPDTVATKTSSQYMQAFLYMITSAYTFDESGAADAYVLDVVGNNPAPAAYSNNMTVVFVAGNTNTGASTVNIEGLGDKDVEINGVALTAGAITAGFRYTLIFDSLNDRFELITTGGKLVDIQHFQTGALATGTTQLPSDDSIPEITEGDEYMTLVYTPKNAANTLIIDALTNVSNGSPNTFLTVALFRDAVTDALAVVATQPPGTNQLMPNSLRHVMVAGGVAAITFRIRAGMDNPGTTTFSGTNGARLYGGVMASSITVTEVTPS